jgi:hypothetical protein
MPPAAVRDALFGIRFVPAPEVIEWVRAVFCDAEGPLFNEDHAHLHEAEIGVLWASDGFVQRGKRVIGTAEEPVFRCGPWQKARQEQQMREWFGATAELDFLITLDAHHSAECDDVDFCALVEHELYHCAQARDEFGIPKFGKNGKPAFALRGHDIEEFVGVVRRYGIGHPDGPMADLIRAVAKGPEVAPFKLGQACGTCMART